jgi:hypothetical protein
MTLKILSPHQYVERAREELLKADPSLDPEITVTDPDWLEIRGLNDADAIVAMVEWFRDNFEDPSVSTPRNSERWVWIWGGPYHAYDELFDTFDGDVSSAAIESAARKVGPEQEWAPACRRIGPESPSSAVEAAKQAVFARLAHLIDPVTGADDGARFPCAVRISAFDLIALLRELVRLQKPESTLFF